MNSECGARAAPTYGGYHGEFRLVHKARWQRLQSEKEKTDLLFDTSDAAEVAAWREWFKRSFGMIVGSGERVGKARQEAEKLFKPKKVVPT